MRLALIISLLLVLMFGTHVIAQEGNGFIAFGETVEADLSSQNQWQFEGAAGNVISIGVDSTAFDATLELLDPQGTLLITDQDSGKNNNPLIRDFTLPTTQMYTIVISAADGNSGTYSLTLTASTNIGCEAYDEIMFEAVDLSSALLLESVEQREEFTYRWPSHWLPYISNRSQSSLPARGSLGTAPGTVDLDIFEIVRIPEDQLPPCGMRQVLYEKYDETLGLWGEFYAEHTLGKGFIQLGNYEAAFFHVGDNGHESLFIHLVTDDALINLEAGFGGIDGSSGIYGPGREPEHLWDWVTTLFAIASTISKDEIPPMVEGQTIPTEVTSENPIIFQDDFVNNSADWEESVGNTLNSQVAEGAYRITYVPSSDLTYWVIAPGYSDWSQAPVMNNPYELHFEVFNVYSSSPTYAIAVLFDVTQGYGTFKRLFIRNDGTWQLYRWSGQRELLGEGQLEGGAVNFEDGRVHEVVLRVDETNYTLSVDGEIKISISRIDPINGSIGFGMDSGGALDGLLYAEFDNLKVYSLE